MSTRSESHPTVAVVGADGQLGRDCMTVLRMHGLGLFGADVPTIDIASEESVSSCLAPAGPTVVVNCAAYTDVDGCESDEAAARRVNAEGARNLARFAEQTGSWLIHVSTDYVFDGQRPAPQPYVETDAPAPATAYGRTKLAGEQAIAEETERYSILRTAWLYGANGKNFPKAILRRALQPGAALRVVNDQHGCPTWSYRLAQQIARVVEHRVPGVFHATGEGHCTWFEFAKRFLDRMGVDCPLEPCSTDAFPRPAPRPANSILENAALASAGLNVMVPWEQDLDAFVAAHREALLAEAQ